MASVPTNTLQRRMQQQSLAGRRPGMHGILYSYGKIVQVYDDDYFNAGGEAPADAMKLINKSPGELVFMIELDTIGTRIPLSSGLSEEVIKSSYGNRPLLLGRRVRVEHQPGRITAGRVQIVSKKKARVNINKATAVPDIGGIL